jgi:micrococcal nuclease
MIVALLALFAGLGFWLVTGSDLLRGQGANRAETSNSFDIRPGVSTPGANAISAETLAGPLPAAHSGSRAPGQSRSTSAAGHFSICHTGGGTNCVVDGDTAWIEGVKVRIADIDAPETHPPRCDSEADLGTRATERMAQLLNAGPFSLEPIDRDRDRYGRSLRIIRRDGQSLGGVLVGEGLARWYGNGRRPWC